MIPLVLSLKLYYRTVLPEELSGTHHSHHVMLPSLELAHNYVCSQ